MDSLDRIDLGLFFFGLLGVMAFLVRIPSLRGLLARDWTGVGTDWTMIALLSFFSAISLDSSGGHRLFATISLVVLLLLLARLMARAYVQEQAQDEAPAGGERE